MTSKNVKTIFFAVLIATVMLPFSGIQFTVAEPIIEPYTLAQIDHAFARSEGYVTYDEDGNMIVDKYQMYKDGVSIEDIQIMDQWATLNNNIINAIEIGNQNNINKIIQNTMSGKFSLLTNYTTSSNNDVSGQTSVNFFSLTACGITYGQTSHRNPIITFNKDGYENLQTIQSALVSDGYHQIKWPWTDIDSVGFDYGKINPIGIGGCNEGEFRDENFIYSDTMPHPDSNGWHTLQQINEPNPELDMYNPPTFWWDVYTALWHYRN